MATYKHLRSSTANKRPTTSIADGQLAINTNTASPGLFFKDSAGTGIVKVGPVHVGTTAPNSTPAAGGSTGNYLGEQWLDTSVSPAQMKVWNGSAWIGVVADELPVSKLQDGAAGQIVQTDSAGTGVEWSSTANLPLGSAAAPAYRFQGDGDSGVYSPGANQVAISTAGTGRLFVDASGNVGVGTSAPGATLHSRADNAGSGSTPLLIQNRSVSANTAVGISFAPNTSDTADRSAIIYGVNSSGGSGNATDLTFHTNANGGSPTERLRITSAGLVGIGTSSPGFPFQVKSTTDAHVAIWDNGGIPQVIGINDAGGSAQLRLAGQILSFTGSGGAGSEHMRLDASGRLGIGTTSPNYALDVSTTGTTISSSFTSDQSEQYIALKDSGTTLGHVRLGSTSGAMLFNAGNAERLRITADGKVGVGTSAPQSIFHIGANAPANAGVKAYTALANSYEGFLFDYYYNTSASNRRVFDVVALGAGAGGALGGSDLRFLTVPASATGTPLEAMRIDSAQRVGIGTQSPGFLGHLQGPTGSSVENVLMLAGGSTGTTGAGARLMLANGGAGAVRCAYIDGVCTDGPGNAHALVFGTNAAASSPQERARIDSSGRLLVGTPTGTAPLTVAGTNIEVRNTNGAYINNSQTTSVSTSATTIIGDAGFQGRLWVINGAEGGNRFCDLVMASTAAAPVVVQSYASFGTPAARTYTRSGSAVQLAMASGTYDVRCIGFGA